MIIALIFDTLNIYIYLANLNDLNQIRYIMNLYWK